MVLQPVGSKCWVSSTGSSEHPFSFVYVQLINMAIRSPNGRNGMGGEAVEKLGHQKCFVDKGAVLPTPSVDLALRVGSSVSVT